MHIVNIDTTVKAGLSKAHSVRELAAEISGRIDIMMELYTIFYG
jgi:hypothetical protein